VQNLCGCRLHPRSFASGENHHGKEGIGHETILALEFVHIPRSAVSTQNFGQNGIALRGGPP
jgi:hypothetical protein